MSSLILSRLFSNPGSKRGGQSSAVTSPRASLVAKAMQVFGAHCRQFVLGSKLYRSMGFSFKLRKLRYSFLSDITQSYHFTFHNNYPLRYGLSNVTQDESDELQPAKRAKNNSQRSRTNDLKDDTESEFANNDKVAVFLCKCGSNIAGPIDIEDLKTRVESRGVSVVEVNDHLCSEHGVYELTTAIRKSGAERVVIAGCTPLLHAELFSNAVREAGIDPGHLHIANIREQCSWVHSNDTEAATAKAATIIDIGLAQVGASNPIKTYETAVVQRAMVIGGGVAGVTAALELADQGIETVLVEKDAFLGGHMAKWDKLFPTFDCSICILGPMMARVADHSSIRLMTHTEIKDIRGSTGRFYVTLTQRPRYVATELCTGCNRCIEVCPVDVVDEYNYGLGTRKAIVRHSLDAVPIAPYIDMDSCVGCQSCSGVCEAKAIRYDDCEKTETIEVGAIVVATGFSPFDPTAVEELGYGENPDVITSLELERIINPSGPTGGWLVKPSDGSVPRSIAFVNCVGSRSMRLNRPYCSRACCAEAVKQSVQVKGLYPDSEIYVFYTDLRTVGKGHEELYIRAAEEYGVKFIRGAVGDVVFDPVKGTTSVRAEDTLLRRPLDLDIDLVVLMVGMDPAPSNKQLSKLLRIPLDENGFFLEQHPKLNLSGTASKGVFLAGVSQAPKDISDTVAHAGLAASKVKTLLTSSTVVIDLSVPVIDHDVCMGCLQCQQVCTPSAIRSINGEKPIINQAACRGCGACVAACPTGALDLPSLTTEQLLKATKSAVRFSGSRPAIVGYLCRWCAYAAADRAGMIRLTYPANIVPIQVPCTGRLDTEIILTAFEEGADGVAVIGCHVQDCHYRSGALHAQERTDNLRMVLEAAGIDGRRLYFGSVAASEAGQYAKQVSDFVSSIVHLGPLGSETGVSAKGRRKKSTKKKSAST
ncbi:MAG: hydrogenase iron-sulfur subunit [Candidatus Thorarchaeota archaeon]|nr:hydrogenase iron-sulfur subunit [Candidatus Thorarchaeota archaeon]